MNARMSAPAMIALASCLLLGACASDNPIGSAFGGGVTTAAVPEKPKVDPACVSLAAQIEGLRKEGVTDRVEAAAKGKSSTVSVKRASLAKMAELDKANAQFQSKCSTLAAPAAAAPVAKSAASVQLPPAAAKPKQAAAETAASTTVAAAAPKTSTGKP